jgi:hypothetical protein
VCNLNNNNASGMPFITAARFKGANRASEPIRSKSTIIWVIILSLSSASVRLGSLMRCARAFACCAGDIDMRNRDPGRKQWGEQSKARAAAAAAVVETGKIFNISHTSRALFN